MSRDFRRDRIPDSVMVGHLSHILKTARSAVPRNSLKKIIHESSLHILGIILLVDERSGQFVLRACPPVIVSGVCDLLNVFARGEDGGDAPLRLCHPSPSRFLHLQSCGGSFSTLLPNAPI